jgi:uncharacterized MAPEG superfamily protein
MSIPFWTLFAAMVLGLVHLTAASFTFKAQVGNSYMVGARDDDLRPQGLAGRLDRAQRNFMETFPIFAAAVLMAAVLGRENRLIEVGALMYLAGRIAFLPLYAAGVRWLRTFSWNIATLGLAMVIVALVWRP